MTDPLPLLPHLTPEFLTWLWCASERDLGTFPLGEGAEVHAWVDDRLSFRTADDDRPRAVLTGENPAASLEARGDTPTGSHGPAPPLFADRGDGPLPIPEYLVAQIEARAALAGGKLVRDLRLGLRGEDREYALVIRGSNLDLAGARLPGMFKGTEDEALFDRMFLLEELRGLIRTLFVRFAEERTALTWQTETLPAMQAWVAGEDG